MLDPIAAPHEHRVRVMMHEFMNFYEAAATMPTATTALNRRCRSG